MNIPTMLTISEAAIKYDIAVHAVRGWVKSGTLPAVMTGKKYLIADENMRNFLLMGTNNHANIEPVGKIRRLG